MNNKRKNIIIFLVIVLISCITFIKFLNMHYATDTYNIIDRGYEEYAIKYSLNDGRLFMSAISLIANQFNVPISIYIISLTFLAIFTSCISVLLLKNIVEKYKKSNNFLEELVLVIICYCTIFNFMFLENMQFAECFVMSISILLCIVGSNILTEANPKYLIKTILCIIPGVLFYQGTLGYFVVMTLVFSIIKDNKKIFKNILLSGIICIVAVLIDLIQIRIVGNLLGMYQSRMGGIANIPYMIINIISSLPNILVNTSYIFPKYVYISFIIILFCLIISNLKEIKYKGFINILLLIFISIGATFAINLFTYAGFGTARMMFPLGALIGNMFILIYATTDMFKNKMSSVLMTLLIAYFIITQINYVFLMKEHENVEKLTIKECQVIGEYISEYEENTGIKLKNIAVYYDTNTTYFYKEIKNYSALCIRPLSVEWGDNGAINYWCNIKLKEIKPNKEVYNTYFINKNWDTLNREQFVFIDDTLHYCVY